MLANNPTDGKELVQGIWLYVVSEIAILLHSYPLVQPSKPVIIALHHKPSRDLQPDDRTVRGTLVRGLTENDVHLLDTFEGDVSRLSTDPIDSMT